MTSDERELAEAVLRAFDERVRLAVEEALAELLATERELAEEVAA